MFKSFFQDIEEKENNYVSVLDNMSLKQALATLNTVIGVVWLADTGLWALAIIETLVPVIANLNFTLLNVAFWLLTAALAIVSSGAFWAKIIFTSRRLDKNENQRTELMWDYLHKFFWQASYIIGSAFAIPLCFSLIPFVQYLRLHPSMKGWTVEMTDAIAGNAVLLRLLFFGTAIVCTVYLHARFQKEAEMNKTKIQKWMATYDFRYKPLRNMLSGKTKKELKEAENQPFLTIGQSLITGDDVVQSPGARRQNAVVFGPIGAGKTSTWFLPQIYQDIKRIITWFRNFAKNRQDPKWDQPYGRQQNFLAGLMVIETTNDLCTNVHDMAVAMGIPEEKIIWLDPDNPNTPSLDLLKGPTEIAARTMTDIVSGLKEDANDFFSQAERAHLSQHIYLLKEASVIEGKPATFTELMRMYNDVYVVAEKREELREYVNILKDKLKKTKKALANMSPDDEDYKAKQTELKDLDDKCKISMETLGWFDSNLTSPQYKNGVKIQQSGPHKGEPVVEDINADKIIGLRNQLTEMSKKMGLRRVLFHESDFDLDDFLKNGGILLCNTAKDSLGAVSAKLLGQIYALAISSATMRRTPNVDAMVPLYMDEFPDYVYAGFTDFAAQARKYNVPINIAAQSPAQLALKFGPDYLRAVFSVMLTRATFGDMGAEDAKTLSALFGTHQETIETVQSQEIDLAADTHRNQTRINSQDQEVPNITPEEIMGMERFTMAVRIPGEKHSDLFDRVSVKRINMTEIESDPNNFDINRPSDRKAFKQMLAVAQHTNTDYDNIDKEIVDEIESGQIQVTKLTPSPEASAPEGGNSQEEMVPHYNGENDKNKKSDSESGVKSSVAPKDTAVSKPKGTTTHNGQTYTIGEDKPGQAPTPTGMQLDDGDDPFGSFGGNINLSELNGDSNTPAAGQSDSSAPAQDNSNQAVLSDSKSSDYDKILSDEEYVQEVERKVQQEENHDTSRPRNTAANYTTEQLKNLVAQSVLKSPNGGNGRFDNNIHTDPQITDDSKEKEDEKNLLYLDKNNNLVKSDESNLEKPDRPSKDKMKANALQNARLGFLQIRDDHSLNPQDKVNKLKRYLLEQHKQLAVLFPKDVDKIISRFKTEIVKLENEQHLNKTVIKGSDDLNTMLQKTNQINHASQLSDELNNVVKGFDDGPLNINGFDEDTSFNDKDPFENQPGMHDDD